MVFGHNGETLEIQKDDYELLLKENPKKIIRIPWIQGILLKLYFLLFG